MRKRPFSNNLLEPRVAVGSYLDQLLHEATHSQADPEEEDKINARMQAENLIVPELLVGESDKQRSLTIVDSDVLVQQATSSKPDLEPGPEPEPEPQGVNLDPELFPLQCLMFRVAGNLLAIPLIRMKSVVPWPTHLTQVPQSPDWMLGLFKHHDRNVRVVDSAWVLHIQSTPSNAPKYVLVLGDDEWAITCDKLENVIKLEYSDIQWRQKSGKSTIFGTLRDSLASLVSPDGIVNTFKSLNLD